MLPRGCAHWLEYKAALNSFCEFFAIGLAAPPIERTLDKSELGKIAFVPYAMQNSSSSADAFELPLDVKDAIRWIAVHTPRHVMKQREAIVRRIEARGELLLKIRANERWFGACDDLVRQVSCEVTARYVVSSPKLSRFTMLRA